MTPHVWTTQDVNAAVALGLLIGVIGTLGLQFIGKAILFPLIDWSITKAQRWTRLRVYRKLTKERASSDAPPEASKAVLEEL